jgi:DNA-directed RNA polymerase subunit RPC12/RpoP
MIPSNNVSVTRVVRERLVTPMVCGRCSHTWDYSGKNQYVATCPLCRSKLSVRKNSVKSLQSARIGTPVQTAAVENPPADADELT